VFDLAQIGLPRRVEAHGRKWIAVYFVGAAKEARADMYLAVEDGDSDGPLPTFLIAVPRESEKP
jgi:hypothetical protein